MRSRTAGWRSPPTRAPDRRRSRARPGRLGKPRAAPHVAGSCRRPGGGSGPRVPRARPGGRSPGARPRVRRRPRSRRATTLSGGPGQRRWRARARARDRMARLDLEAHGRRASFLQEAASQLGCAARVHVVAERAEIVGRDPAHRGRYPLVVARSFGPPAVTAECASPLLAPGGVLVVSEPPASGGARWRPDGLSLLGAAPDRLVRTAKGTFQLIRQASPCPSRYPRRVGVPSKRPLF